MLAADQQKKMLLETTDALLTEQTHSLAVPMSAVNLGLVNISQAAAANLNKVVQRILQPISKGLVSQDSLLDPINVTIIQGVDTWLQEQTFLLTQLAASAGLCQPGQPLETALLDQATEEPELAYSAILALSIRDLRDVAKCICEALREIRDRLPPQPLAVPGEPLASGDVLAEVIAAQPLAKEIPVARDWPEV